MTQLIVSKDEEVTEDGATVPNYVVLFRDGDPLRKDIYGGKGAGLAEMTKDGAPVPPGFIITTEACNKFSNTGQIPEGMMDQVMEAKADVERQTGKRFGDPSNPLLVSVRSGAPISMPGMMDTVLNLGMNPQVRDGMARLTNNPRFAADSYRRFIQLYGEIVLDVDKKHFDPIMEKAKGGDREDTDLSTDELNEIAEKFKAIVLEVTGETFPEDPNEQLEKAIVAVFRSWNGRRAVDYRRLNKISDDLGTAVNVQMMVFGNMGDDSGTGVAFSRDVATGEDVLYGEFLRNAQGEDVVAGIRTPRPISELALEMPEMHAQFCTISKTLEKRAGDVQDMEFTIERGVLYMLQKRTAQRTAAAAIRIAVEMVEQGMLTRKQAIMRVAAQRLEELLHPMIVPAAKKEAIILTSGLPASPGAASGVLVFDPDDAVKFAKQGLKVILARTTTAPDDFHGMAAAEAVLTSTGGMTSHASVVARGMGKPCVVGAKAIHIDNDAQTLTVNGKTFKKGDPITLDGGTGEVFPGLLPTQEPVLDHNFHTLMGWADEFRTIKVRANADSPALARKAREYGCQGIGLCRTEHMFEGEDRIDAVREMILAETLEERQAALDKILPFLLRDFTEIFREMAGLPVTIRLLDPPLHEFLPKTDEAIRELARKLKVDYDVLKRKVDSLREENPMLGFRGCRLGIAFPEITKMQVRAIFMAVQQVRGEGIEVHPEVMVPLVVGSEEFVDQKTIIDEVAQELGLTEYLVGSMIETPAVTQLADEIAETADFFSLGTNDLTQMGMGISRDDSGRFVPLYIEKKILKDDPFQVLHQESVGKLVKTAIALGRSVKPNLKVGVCGEHGGDPASVEFFVRAGLDYVSCSPPRLPIARLAAAQAAIKMEEEAAV